MPVWTEVRSGNINLEVFGGIQTHEMRNTKKVCGGGKEMSLKTNGPSEEGWGKEPEKASEKARDQENRRKTSSKYRKTRERSILRKRE